MLAVGNNCQLESECVSRKSRLEWNARLLLFSWIMTFIEHSFDDQFSNIKIRRYNLGSIFSQFDFCLECFFLGVVSFSRSSILRVSVLKIKEQRQSLLFRSTIRLYAGHISHLFKITAILIGVFLFRFCFHLSVSFSLLYGVWCMCELCESVSILFFEHLNMKYRVFNDRIASSLSLSSPQDTPRLKQHRVHTARIQHLNES